MTFKQPVQGRKATTAPNPNAFPRPCRCLCGGKAFYRKMYKTGGDLWIVECDALECERIVSRRTPGEAVEQWNSETRVAKQAIKQGGAA
jgi:hypothetical protein